MNAGRIRQVSLFGTPSLFATTAAPPRAAPRATLFGTPSLFAAPTPAPRATFPWWYVRRRFELLLDELNLTTEQANDGETKCRGVLSCLDRDYWSGSDATAHGALIGSWGKRTRVRPPRDIDMFFVLPVEVYWRFQRRIGNRQSQLLQEVKAVLRETYPSTNIRGDGQVVVVPFNTFRIEVVPAFPLESGGYLICDTNDGGRYKRVDPSAEIAALDIADKRLNGNIRKLTRILKQWQRNCGAAIEPFQLEALLKELLPRISYGAKSEFWFDWLVRDAFAYMIHRANGWIAVPGMAGTIFLGDEWLGRARSAYAIALHACQYEYHNFEALAGEEWRKIFGRMTPVMIS